MVGISGRAGPSGSYNYSGHTDNPEPVSGRARDSNSEANSSRTRPHLRCQPDVRGFCDPWRCRAKPESGWRRACRQRRRLECPSGCRSVPLTPRRRHVQRKDIRNLPMLRRHMHVRTLQAPASTSPLYTGAVPRANRIVQQLVEAGADLANIRTMFRNMLRGEEMILSRAEQNVFLQHFPDMLPCGIDRNSELAIALRERSVERIANRKIASFVTPWMSSISTTGILSYESSPYRDA